jgi:hypothetical protein
MLARSGQNPITTAEKPAIIRLLVAELTTWKAHSGPSSAKARVESQLAAWAIVGCEHITIRDQAKNSDAYNADSNQNESLNPTAAARKLPGLAAATAPSKSLPSAIENRDAPMREQPSAIAGGSTNVDRVDRRSGFDRNLDFIWTRAPARDFANIEGASCLRPEAHRNQSGGRDCHFRPHP